MSDRLSGLPSLERVSCWSAAAAAAGDAWRLFFEADLAAANEAVSSFSSTESALLLSSLVASVFLFLLLLLLLLLLLALVVPEGKMMTCLNLNFCPSESLRYRSPHALHSEGLPSLPDRHCLVLLVPHMVHTRTPGLPLLPAAACTAVAV